MRKTNDSLISEARQSLENLIRSFPLPHGWKAPEVFFESAELGPVRALLLGLYSSFSETTSATASAAALDRYPIERAYFELIERISIIEFEKQAKAPGPSAGAWVLSRSNGVACHTDKHLAKTASLLEVLERHTVLKYWYSQKRPDVLCMDDQNIDSKVRNWLKEDYAETYLCHFTSAPSVHSVSPYVTAIFGFPRRPEVPFLCGFSARQDLASSIQHSINEGIQRVGFLWGEEFSTDLPEPSATPDFHLAYFANQAGYNTIYNWLGGNTAAKSNVRSHEEQAVATWTDLTPPEFKNKFWVMKAQVTELLPLTFGIGNPLVDSLQPEAFLIHPIS